MASYVSATQTTAIINGKSYRVGSFRLEQQHLDVTNFESDFKEYVYSEATCSFELLEMYDAECGSVSEIKVFGYSFSGFLIDYDVICGPDSLRVITVRFKVSGPLSYSCDQAAELAQASLPTLYRCPPLAATPTKSLPYISTRRRKILMREAV